MKSAGDALPSAWGSPSLLRRWFGRKPAPNTKGPPILQIRANVWLSFLEELLPEVTELQPAMENGNGGLRSETHVLFPVKSKGNFSQHHQHEFPTVMMQHETQVHCENLRTSHRSSRKPFLCINPSYASSLTVSRLWMDL